MLAKVGTNHKVYIYFSFLFPASCTDMAFARIMFKRVEKARKDSSQHAFIMLRIANCKRTYGCCATSGFTFLDLKTYFTHSTYAGI